MNPPRYLHRLDRDAFLREWANYAHDTIGTQAGRDFARLAEDLERADEDHYLALRDLEDQVASLEDALFKIRPDPAEQFRAPSVDPFMREETEETET